MFDGKEVDSHLCRRSKQAHHRSYSSAGGHWQNPKFQSLLENPLLFSYVSIRVILVVKISKIVMKKTPLMIRCIDILLPI
jgi:hypothetical protein